MIRSTSSQNLIVHETNLLPSEQVARFSRQKTCASIAWVLSFSSAFVSYVAMSSCRKVSQCSDREQIGWLISFATSLLACNAGLCLLIHFDSKHRAALLSARNSQI